MPLQILIDFYALVVKKTMEDLLIILKTPPYRKELSKLALDLAITFAIFEQKVSILLIGDGCLQLHPDQNTKHSSHRNHLKTLASLSLYEINNVYIESNSFNKTGLNSDELNETFKIINSDSAKQLIADSDHILGF